MRSSFKITSIAASLVLSSCGSQEPIDSRTATQNSDSESVALAAPYQSSSTTQSVQTSKQTNTLGQGNMQAYQSGMPPPTTASTKMPGTYQTSVANQEVTITYYTLDDETGKYVKHNEKRNCSSIPEYERDSAKLYAKSEEYEKAKLEAKRGYANAKAELANIESAMISDPTNPYVTNSWYFLYMNAVKLVQSKKAAYAAAYQQVTIYRNRAIIAEAIEIACKAAGHWPK